MVNYIILDEHFLQSICYINNPLIFIITILTGHRQWCLSLHTVSQTVGGLTRPRHCDQGHFGNEKLERERLYNTACLICCLSEGFWPTVPFPCEPETPFPFLAHFFLPIDTCPVAFSVSTPLFTSQ